jgi:MtN3 and saliva related transmembrane protein
MTPQMLVDVLGAGAAVCSTTSFIPQLIKLIRERSAEAVSTRMFVLTVTAFSLWSAYGLMLGSWPLVVSNLVSLALSGAILLLTLRLHAQDAARERPAPR